MGMWAGGETTAEGAASPDAQASLCLRLFGAGEILISGVRTPRPKQRKDFLLLALLAMRHGQALERDWLAGMLWPDSEQSQALYNLRRSLSIVRGLLGKEGGRILSPTSRTVEFSAEGARIDALQFDKLTRQRTPDALREAVALYRGPFLEGFDVAWALTERNAREQAYLDARQALAEHANETGDWGAAARHLRAIIEIDPLRETAQGQLMRVLAAGGEVGSAIQAYRALRLHLHQELNMPPSAETIALYQRIQKEARQTVSPPPAVSSSVRQAALPSPISLPAAPPLPEGTVSARQEEHRGATENNSTNGRDAAAENRADSFLPQPLTRLIGREQEAEEVWEQLRAARLVTLTGTGGVGKTRLATHVAAENRAAYPQGVWFVDLSGVSRSEQVLPAIASALKVQETPGQPLETTLADWFRPRRVLLVLDNCEHLAGECGRIVSLLLQSAVGLQVLATSRRPLELAGEVTWRVPSLGLPHAEWEFAGWTQTAPEWATRESLPELLASDAVLFFVERACQARPGFRLTARNACLVARLCLRLDGIPLALELAAGRLRAMSLPQLVSRLDDCFTLLTSASPVSTRQQTLRALIDWSVALLTPSEKSLLARLSVFSGGWTLEAAEAIAKDEGGRRKDEDNAESIHPSSFILPPLLDALTGLVDKSLVVFEERNGIGRYCLLETVRQYAREQLSVSRENDALWLRHAEFYLNFARKWDQELEGAGQIGALHEIQAEHGNFRAALDACLSEPTLEARDTGMRFVNTLRRFWMMRDHFSEARFYIQAFLNHPAGSIEGFLRAEALNGLGAFYKNQGHCAQARVCYEEALTWAQSQGDAELCAKLQGNLSDVARTQGCYSEARQLLEASLQWGRQTGNLYTEGRCLSGLGMLAEINGDYETALRFHEAALETGRKMDNPHALGMGLLNCGTIRMNTGDYAGAEKCFVEALTLHQKLNSKYNKAMALLCLAKLAFYNQAYQEARRYLGEALRDSEQVGDPTTLAKELLLLARLEAAQGNAALAARLWGMMQPLSVGEALLTAPEDARDVEQFAEELRQALGAEARETAMAQGRTLSRDQALAEIAGRVNL